MWCVEFQTDLDLLLNALTRQGSREREHARGFMDISTPVEPPVVMDLEATFKRLPMLDSNGMFHYRSR